ncbi:hypothetical protein [Rhodococcus koreensis]|uniref:hypothetical protein n=1 Tax=Rhodococcus koreensis TaxID=99653 RepID=UPI0036DA990A
MRIDDTATVSIPHPLHIPGAIDTWTALREVTGTDVDRTFFVQILHGLSDRNPAAPPLSAASHSRR